MTKNFSANLKIGAVMGSSVGKVFGGVNRKMKEQEAELKRLRSAYKDAAKGTGEYAGKLDELQREIDKTEAKLKRLRAASRIDLGKSIKGIGSKMWGDTKRLGLAGGVIGGAGLAIGKNMLDTTAAFEKSLTILKTVEGSGEKAQKSFGWIQDFAQRTPFELQQVTDAFVRMRAYGMDPIRGDALRILGDTASAMGKDVMDAVEAVADALTGENERLKEFGIKSAKEGGKITYEYTNRAGKQMRKTVDANNRAMIQSTLLAIYNEKYKGAMAEQSKTWNGMVSNLKDTWARFAYMVMQSGPFEELKVELGNLLKQVEVWANDGTMKRWADETGKFMKRAGSEIKKFGIQLFTALDYVQNFLGGWDKLVWAVVAVNFVPTIAAVASLGKSLWVLSGATWAAVGPWLALAAAIGAVVYTMTHQEEVGDKVYKFWEAIAGEEFVAKFWDSVLEYQLSYEAFIQWNIEKSAQLRQAVGEIFASIGEAMINGFKTAFEWIETKLNALMTTFSDFGSRVKSFFGFGGDTASSTAAPVTPSGSMPPQASTANQTNHWSINVNAPGGDGRRIADSIRNEFNSKPLYDMDSFAPAR